MPLYEVGGNRPRIHPTAFVHPDAVLMGRVEIGPGCYVGAGAVLRGDWVTIKVGAGSNIQDNCVIHGEPGGEVVLEEDAHLGHACMVHGARVGRNVLVGMKATVSDRCDLGEGCIVGAGALVPSGMAVPPGHLVVGVPARVTGQVRPALAEEKRLGTLWYQELARRSLHHVHEVEFEDCMVRPATGGTGHAEETEGGSWRPWIEETEVFRPPAESGGSRGGC